MLPLRDDNPSHTIPWINGLLILINLSAFVYLRVLHPHGMEAVGPRLGFIPYEFSHGIDVAPANLVPWPLTPLTAMFLHAGWLHLLGNLLYLWIFGDNVEDLLGHRRYLGFYLFCGIAAAALHAGVNADSRIPALGASGAIAGVLGAYLVLFPRARIHTLVFLGIYVKTFKIPAVALLGYWALIQAASALAEYRLQTAGGIAWFAHMGGFAAGLLVASLMKKNRRRRPGRKKRPGKISAAK